MPTDTKCPACNRKLTPRNDGLFWCGHCSMLTDGIYDGTVGYGNQEHHASRKEEYELRQKKRRFDKAHPPRRR